MMRIADDGRGFDASPGANHRGLGLLSMGERVRILGGRFELEAAPGAGTVATVTLPAEALARVEALLAQGRRVILEPADEWSEEFRGCLGAWHEEIPRLSIRGSEPWSTLQAEKRLLG